MIAIGNKFFCTALLFLTLMVLAPDLQAQDDAAKGLDQLNVDQTALFIEKLFGILNIWILVVLLIGPFIMGPIISLTAAAIVFQPESLIVRTIKLVLLQFVCLIGLVIALFVVVFVSALLGPFGFFLFWFAIIGALFLYLAALPAKVYDGSIAQGLIFAIICLAFNAAVAWGQQKAITAMLTEEKQEKIVRLGKAYRAHNINSDMDYGASDEARLQAIFDQSVRDAAPSTVSTNDEKEAELKARYAELMTMYENLDQTDADAVQNYQSSYEAYERELKRFRESPTNPTP